MGATLTIIPSVKVGVKLPPILGKETKAFECIKGDLQFLSFFSMVNRAGSDLEEGLEETFLWFQGSVDHAHWR